MPSLPQQSSPRARVSTPYNNHKEKEKAPDKSEAHKPGHNWYPKDITHNYRIPPKQVKQ